MRHSYICPKCDSRKVVEVVGSSINQYQKIPLHAWNIKNAILDRYICADCGYTEEFVQLNEGFKKWVEKALKKRGGPSDGFV